MASIGHIAVGMAAARVYRKEGARLPLAGSMLLWSALSLLPDADVIGFSFGVRYADPWGHRGATHSFAFALVIALCAACLSPALKLSTIRTLSFVALVVASHPLLDALTNGGLGCALLWPFSDERFFAPFHPIPVAPIGRRFFSARGLSVAIVEALEFAPLLVYALWPRRDEKAPPPPDFV